MTLAEILDNLAQLSGKSDRSRLLAAVKLARDEIWNTFDIPGTMMETRVYTEGERYVTLPWQVYKVRGVMNCHDKVPLELNTVHVAYHDYEWDISPWKARILKPVSLQKKIVNASTLTFRIKKTVDFPITFNIVGETDLSSRICEEVVLEAGEESVETLGRFIEVPESITKSVSSTYDVEILDAEDNILATFPNHLLACRFVHVQLISRYVTTVDVYSNFYDILFKPHAPELTLDSDSFPDPWHVTLIAKALEYLNLDHADKVAIASVYNEKGAATANQFSEDSIRGKTIRENKKRNPFVTPGTANI